jgi:hypothetical protein
MLEQPKRLVIKRNLQRYLMIDHLRFLLVKKFHLDISKLISQEVSFLASAPQDKVAQILKNPVKERPAASRVTKSSTWSAKRQPPPPPGQAYGVYLPRVNRKPEPKAEPKTALDLARARAIKAS